MIAVELDTLAKCSIVQGRFANLGSWLRKISQEKYLTLGNFALTLPCGNGVPRRSDFIDTFRSRLEVMSGLLETGSSPSEVESLDLDEVSFLKCRSTDKYYPKIHLTFNSTNSYTCI